MIVLRSITPPAPHDRLTAWQAKHNTLPADFRQRSHRFAFPWSRFLCWRTK